MKLQSWHFAPRQFAHGRPLMEASHLMRRMWHLLHAFKRRDLPERGRGPASGDLELSIASVIDHAVMRLLVSSLGRPA